MTTIICTKCKKIIAYVPDNWNRNITCNNCGGYFKEYDVPNNLSISYPNYENIDKFKTLINKAKDYLFYVIVIVIIIYAGYRILF